jgi:hypothetical protein
MKEGNKMKEEGKKEMMENQEEKGKVVEFEHFHRWDKVYTSENGDKYVVTRKGGDEDVDFAIAHHSLLQSGWHLCGLYQVYKVEVKENVLRFEYLTKNEEGKRAILWKEVILKGDQ